MMEVVWKIAVGTSVVVKDVCGGRGVIAVNVVTIGLERPYDGRHGCAFSHGV